MPNKHPSLLLRGLIFIFVMTVTSHALSGAAHNKPCQSIKEGIVVIQKAMMQKLMSECHAVGAATFTSATYKVGAIKHIVLLRYKSAVTLAQKEEIKQRFFDLKNTAQRHGKPYIDSIVGGEQMSGEGLGGGFDHGFIVTFKSEGDRNYYVGSPIVSASSYYDSAHESFKKYISPLLDLERGGALVFDFHSSI